MKYNAWLVLQGPWYYQRQERRAKTAGSTDSPTLCPHMGFHWMSLQGDQRWQRSKHVHRHFISKLKRSGFKSEIQEAIFIFLG